MRNRLATLSCGTYRILDTVNRIESLTVALVWVLPLGISYYIFVRKIVRHILVGFMLINSPDRIPTDIIFSPNVCIRKAGSKKADFPNLIIGEQAFACH
jgi:hypothetical protein